MMHPSTLPPVSIVQLVILLFISVGNLCHANSPPSPLTSPIDVVIGVDGGTESIRACCFDANSGQILGQSHAVPYVTSHPHPGWAEQSPKDWYENLVGAVRGAVDSLPSSTYNIRAICCDTTCCSVVALSNDYTPLRPCLLWMDARSAKQAKQIMDVANEIASSTNSDILKAFPELRVNCNGEGPISAEWLLPKAMWIKEHEPHVYENAEIICEYQDYLNYRLTGKMVASGCNVAVRWHHDGWDSLEKNHGSHDDKNKGRPVKLYEALGMNDLAAKLPQRTLAMGDVIGTLTEQAASDLNLPKQTLVVQGGPDAFVGMIGLGTIRPGQLCLITGSSHLHCLITPQPTSAPGTWGAYRGAPLAHTCFAEGGQSSTGSLVRWVRDLVSGPVDDKVSYKVLDDEAAAIPPGSDGLVALETWQGSRTPHTDPLARGAFAGLTLAHSRAHVFRSILEAVCFGTRSCFDALEAAASQTSDMPKADEVVLAGGATNSPLWIQLHADITGRTFVLNENSDGPLLGCAVLASVGAGIHASVDDAVEKMIRRERKIEPREDVRKIYDRLYKELYLKLRPGVKQVFQAISEVRGGDASNEHSSKPFIISPSLLAADW
jgi:ribulose kinase